MATMIEFKKQLKSNPEIAKMIMPSSRNEIFFSFEGNGKIDFALLDINGENRVDTFAIDLTGDGSLDVYFTDSDGNGICDTVKVVADGDYVPSMAFVDKGMEEKFDGKRAELREFFENCDADKLVEKIKGIKERLQERGKAYRSCGTIGKLRSLILGDPETAKFVCPSAYNEIYLDVDGDGKADFGFISNGADNYPDTFAIDLGCDGEFDLYLSDTDHNGLPDFVTYFEDNGELVYTSKEPTKEVEEALAPVVEKFTSAVRAEWSADAFVSALKNFKNELIAIQEKYNIGK